ncbi:MAG TPA: LacI family DNA-binding transcriptional regulator [Propionibacteriaceae bacterium]|nr:LacI family DNA-binding transcriptional regulator [Propionibacteriaceae bacterium]
MARATVKTLAQLVGVSPSTVSNAYNRPDQLSAELRDRIMAKAAEIGYAGPDAAGRSLRSGRADAVGVLLTERLSYAFSDPFAIGFLTGLSEVVEQRGTSIVLLPVYIRHGEPDITSVRQANVDALTTLCLPEQHPASLLAKARGIRVVSTDRNPDPTSSWVAIDDHQAGAVVGAHLAALGHRDVVVLVEQNQPAGSPPREVQAVDVTPIDYKARLSGLRAAMPDARLTLLSGGHNAVESGAAAMSWLLHTPRRPTAIVGLSDVLALGALSALQAAGVDVPGEVSICGFDDIPAAESARLTTLHQPIGDKGRRVGELLLNPDAPQQQVLLPIELRVRQTTGPASPLAHSRSSPHAVQVSAASAVSDIRSSSS